MYRCRRRINYESAFGTYRSSHKVHRFQKASARNETATENAVSLTALLSPRHLILRFRSTDGVAFPQILSDEKTDQRTRFRRFFDTGRRGIFSSKIELGSTFIRNVSLHFSRSTNAHRKKGKKSARAVKLHRIRDSIHRRTETLLFPSTIVVTQERKIEKRKKKRGKHTRYLRACASSASLSPASRNVATRTGSLIKANLDP